MTCARGVRRLPLHRFSLLFSQALPTIILSLPGKISLLFPCCCYCFIFLAFSLALSPESPHISCFDHLVPDWWCVSFFSDALQPPTTPLSKSLRIRPSWTVWWLHHLCRPIFTSLLVSLHLVQVSSNMGGYTLNSRSVVADCRIS